MALKTIEQFRTEATAEVEAEKPLYVQSTEKGRYECSDSDYAQIIEDRAQSKLDEQNNGYARARQQAYAPIPEQLDMLYHDMTSGKGDKTGDWYKAIKKVKTDNPKPS